MSPGDDLSTEITLIQNGTTGKNGLFYDGEHSGFEHVFESYGGAGEEGRGRRRIECRPCTWPATADGRFSPIHAAV